MTELCYIKQISTPMIDAALTGSLENLPSTDIEKFPAALVQRRK